MTAPIALRAGVLRTTLEDGAVVLSDPDRVTVFDAVVEKAVLPLIDGERTGSALATAAAEVGCGNFDVVEALLRLQSAGWIEVVRAPIRVAVVGIAAAVEALREGIGAAAGLTLEGDGAEVTVVIARDYLDEAVAELARESSGPVLLCRPAGEDLWIGPVLVPGETACWDCLAHRLRRNREGLALLAADAPEDAASAAALVDLLVAQLREYGRSAREHQLRGLLVTVDTTRLTSSRHVVTRRPQCAHCGDPTAEPAPVRLAERPRVGDGESGFRAVGPEDLLRDYNHHVSPITGIAKGIWRVGDEDAVHVYRAPHMSNHPAADWGEFRGRGRNAAGGKGTTAVQGRASALGESLERYSSVWDGTEPTETASFVEMAARSEPILHPRECMLFSDAQYADRKVINANKKSFKESVPKLYEDDRQIHWSKIWSLTQGRWVWAPAAYVYFGAPQKKHYVIGESNGNAAGASIEDAVLQGFLELVERDSVALWWYNALPKAGVRLDGIDDAYIDPLRQHFARLGREFWVLDLTADLTVPAFVCVSRRLGDGPDEVTMGFGAHVDPRVGILRSIAEMNQLMPAALREIDRPDRPVEEIEDDGTSAHLLVDETPYLTPDPNQPERTLGDFETLDDEDLGRIARQCQALVESAGTEMLVHDLTRPDVGLPVVKVVVPGMRHFWPRFAPGRLYDVPVQMGWLDRALTEQELNPVKLNG